MKPFYYRQPRYFNKFSCIGGNCPESCCEKWKIDWFPDELEKLRKADMPDDLKERVSKCFVEERNLFSVELREDGSCPFHNQETGLCDIQKALGAEYLGNTCTCYPRMLRKKDNIIFRRCALTCPAVIDLLYTDKNAMMLENYAIKDFSSINPMIVQYDSDKTVAEHPVIKYRFDMIDFFTPILSNTKRSVEASIVLGALAAKHLSDAAENNRASEIPKIMKDLAPQFNSPATARSVEDIKPNYQLKFKLVNNTIVQFYGGESVLFNISALHDGNELVVERYNEGIENFRNAFKDRDYVLRNIFLNLFYTLNMPLRDKEKTIFENYAYYVICCAMIKTIAAAVGYNKGDIPEEFKLAVAGICRGIAHNSKKVTDVIDNMKELGLTTPAHLALIIK